MEDQNKQESTPAAAPGANKSDAEKNKAIAMLSYLIFFLPLLTAKDSKFATYHANQGLLVFLAALAVYVIGTIIPFIGWFVILPLGQLFSFILIIIGMVNAYKGRMKPLPIIGGIEIIK